MNAHSIFTPLSAILLFSLLLNACSSRQSNPVITLDINQSKLPQTNLNLNIAGLGPCTDNPKRSLSLNSDQPLIILTHGCFGSAGQFRALAQVLAFQGQQSACFEYDDRANLDTSASQLSVVINQVSGR